MRMEKNEDSIKNVLNQQLHSFRITFLVVVMAGFFPYKSQKTNIKRK